MERYSSFIDGEWTDANRAECLDITDPASGETVAQVAQASAAEVDRAVTAARKALDSSDWACDGALRAAVMLEWANRLSQQVEPLASQLTRENGKVLGEARFEIGSQVGVIRYNAGLARTVSGRAQSLGRDVFGVVAREPMGVVAVISPWNWPITLMIRDMAPALAAGNALIVKPSSQTVGVAIEVLRLLASCPGLPPGILNVVAGTGRTVGQAIVEHPDVDMIAFTGDASTGRALMASAAASLKKLALELGGKSPMVVCADANLDRAIPELVSAAITTTSGQICTAPSRLVVERSIRAEVVERLRTAVSSIRVGSGLDPASQMGPLTTREQMAKVNRYVELGRREARLVAGGEPVRDPALARGAFVMPAVFDDVSPDSALVRDEIFGPVLVIQSFEGDAEAIRVANQTPYGLASGVWTENLNRAWRLARAIKAGTVWVNTYNRFYPETEVGGYKASGVGRMAGIEGLNEFTQTKHINFDGRGAEAGVGKTSK